LIDIRKELDARRDARNVWQRLYRKRQKAEKRRRAALDTADNAK
jgi:hypothetical protein